mmetsp:Transcript_891/g.2897  ORF Transcript_891/g.2897 Transcript_891/m.2897 type:complete len:263 (+) Transcript_891:566-1354(+)
MVRYAANWTVDAEPTRRTCAMAWVESCADARGVDLEGGTSAWLRTRNTAKGDATAAATTPPISPPSPCPSTGSVTWKTENLSEFNVKLYPTAGRSPRCRLQRSCGLARIAADPETAVRLPVRLEAAPVCSLVFMASIGFVKKQAVLAASPPHMASRTTSRWTRASARAGAALAMPCQGVAAADPPASTADTICTGALGHHLSASSHPDPPPLLAPAPTRETTRESPHDCFPSRSARQFPVPEARTPSAPGKATSQRCRRTAM